jgi:pyridine nucleotide-disulfide oxidoreductase domain-containing protein 1
MNANDSNVYGSALGPDWAQNLEIKGTHKERSHNVLVENECEIKRIMTRSDYLKEFSNDVKLNTNDDVDDWPVYVELTNSKVYGCDFIVSATGVRPCVEAFTKSNQVNNRSFSFFFFPVNTQI